MKLSLPLSLAVLSTLSASTLGATITRYHTHYHTVVHTHTIYSTHYLTRGANGETTAVPDTTTAQTTEAVPTTEAAVTTSTEKPAAPTTTSTSSSSSTSSTSSTTTAAPVTTTSTSSTSTSATSTPTSAFAASILSEHNKKRALHGVDPLTWSSELEAYAQAYADNYDCNSGALVHSGGPYGENLALGYNTIPAVDAWYDEIDLYDYSNPGFSEATGHFTQVVWKSSTQLGCAAKQCGSYYGQYTICSYSPAGNVIGYFEENVLPLV